MNDVIPGILEKEWSEIEKKLEEIMPFSKNAHIDIIDGKFVDNLTFLDPEPFKKYSQDFFFELHMMVDDPIVYLKTWADAGFKRFVGHIEKMSSQEEFVKEAKKYGQVVLALDGPTAISEIKVNLDSIDGVLIYTSDKVGFAGPPLNIQRLDKVKELRAKSSSLVIEADGGIDDQTLLLAKEAGANRFITNSFLYKSLDPQKTFTELLQE